MGVLYMNRVILKKIGKVVLKALFIALMTKVYLNTLSAFDGHVPFISFTNYSLMMLIFGTVCVAISLGIDIFLIILYVKMKKTTEEDNDNKE